MNGLLAELMEESSMSKKTRTQLACDGTKQLAQVEKKFAAEKTFRILYETDHYRAFSEKTS